MKHFTAEQWADFARGVVGNESKSIMQSHLESCKACAREVTLWQRVSQTAKRQPTTEPSEGAVRYAKSMFAARGYSATQKDTAPSMARLLFDSMRGPALAGVRSAASGPRQLLFGLGDHRIDLRMEPRLDSEKVTIIGQVLDSANPAKVFSKVPISLHLGSKLVAVAETNEFGEFQLECELAGRLQLRAALPQGQKISVALVEPAAPQTNDHPYLADSAKEKKLLREVKNRTRKRV